MRGTASFLTRFWKDQSGAAPAEVIIIVTLIAVALVGASILVKSSISQVHIDR